MFNILKNIFFRELLQICGLFKYNITVFSKLLEKAIAI